MKYITGIHALNLPCKLDTVGDWHQSAIQWNHPQIRESTESVFGDYGIEPGHHIPEHEGTYYYAADTIRALLDMLDSGDFTNAQGMNHAFIDNSDYDNEVFSKVLLLRKNSNWDAIDHFMENEYKMKWVRFKEAQEIG